MSPAGLGIGRSEMRYGTHAVRHRLLEEAFGREAHAGTLATLAACRPMDVHVPTLWVLARSQRIRAMELRGSAAVLSHPHRRDGRSIGG